MQIDTIDQLKKALLVESLPALYLLSTKDVYLRRTATDLVQKRYREADRIKLRGDRLTVAELHSALNSSSLLASSTLIVLSEAEALKKAHIEQITRFATQPGMGITLLLIAPTGLRANSLLSAAVKERGILFRPSEPKPWEKEQVAVQWVQQEAKELGKQLSATAAQCLVQRIGPDLALLKQELDKVSCYIGERSQISQEDIGAICSQLRHESGWQLGERVFALDGAGALDVAYKLLGEGAHLVALVAMLRRQVEELLLVLAFGATGGVAAIAQQMPQLRGRQAERKLQIAQHYGDLRLKRALILLAESELAIKNSGGDLSTLTTRLISQLTQ